MANSRVLQSISVSVFFCTSPAFAHISVPFEMGPEAPIGMFNPYIDRDIFGTFFKDSFEPSLFDDRAGVVDELLGLSFDCAGPCGSIATAEAGRLMGLGVTISGGPVGGAIASGIGTLGAVIIHNGLHGELDGSKNGSPINWGRSEPGTSIGGTSVDGGGQERPRSSGQIE